VYIVSPLSLMLALNAVLYCLPGELQRLRTERVDDATCTKIIESREQQVGGSTPERLSVCCEVIVVGIGNKLVRY